MEDPSPVNHPQEQGSEGEVGGIGLHETPQVHDDTYDSWRVIEPTPQEIAKAQASLANVAPVEVSNFSSMLLRDPTTPIHNIQEGFLSLLLPLLQEYDAQVRNVVTTQRDLVSKVDDLGIGMRVLSTTVATMLK